MGNNLLSNWNVTLNNWKVPNTYLYIANANNTDKEVTKNKLTINGDDTNIRFLVVGSSSSGKVNDNELIINGGNFIQVKVGSTGFLMANGNKLTINNGKFTDVVFAGHGNNKKSKTNNNIAIINNGEFFGDLFSGSAKDGANLNKLTIFYAKVISGDTIRGDANGNEMTIKGAVFNEGVYVGVVEGEDGGKANDNIMNLEGGDFTNLKASIYLGANIDNDYKTSNYFKQRSGDFTYDGNTLNYNGGKDFVLGGNLYNANILNFVLLKDLANDDTLLNINGGENAEATDLSQVKDVTLKIKNGENLTKLKDGEHINLIHNENGVTGFKEVLKRLTAGATMSYDFLVKSGDSGKDLIALLQKSNALNPKNKFPANSFNAIQTAGYGALSSLDNLVSYTLQNINSTANFNQPQKVVAETTIATDTIISQNSQNSAFNNTGGEELISFASVGGFFSNYDNTDVDIDGFNALAGIGTGYDNSFYGAFVEYANADFDSNLGGVKTDGDIETYGIGVMVKHFFNENFYFDAYGKIGNNESSQKSIINDAKFDFDLKGTYYGFGANLGYFADYGSIFVDSRLGYAFFNLEGDEKTFTNNDFKI